MTTDRSSAVMTTDVESDSMVGAAPLDVAIPDNLIVGKRKRSENGRICFLSVSDVTSKLLSSFGGQQPPKSALHRVCGNTYISSKRGCCIIGEYQGEENSQIANSERF